MPKILNIKPYLRSIVRYPVPLSKNELYAYRKGSKIFVNSLPKSGTFLLRHTLQLLPSSASRWSIHGLDASRPHLYQKITKRGGSDRRQIETIRAITDYLKLDLCDEETTQVAKQLFSAILLLFAKVRLEIGEIILATNTNEFSKK